MKIAPEVSYHGVEKTAAIADLIQRKVEKLERVSDYISSCRVAIEQQPHHRRSGNPYRVRVELTVPPSHTVVAVQESAGGKVPDQLSVVIREAFEAARRQLQKLVDQQRGDVKSHPEQQEATAFIVRLFADDGYGFVRTVNGDEIYFHRNSVLNDAFERLELGTAVRVEEALELGDQGPQASTVEIIDKPGASITERPHPATEPPPGWR